MRLFVGNGIGPLILASVAVAASTILSHAACMCDVSKDFNRILIFDAATGAAAVGEEKRRRARSCQFLISKRDDDDDTDDEKMTRGSLNPFREEVYRAATTCGPKEVLLFQRGGPSFFLCPTFTKGYPLLRFFLHEVYKKSFSRAGKAHRRDLGGTFAAPPSRAENALSSDAFVFRRRHRAFFVRAFASKKCARSIVRTIFGSAHHEGGFGFLFLRRGRVERSASARRHY